MRDTFATIMSQRLPVRSIEELSKWQLFSALGGKGVNACLKIGGVTVLLVSIERESGCGSSYNLTVHYNGENHKVYCRTKD